METTGAQGRAQPAWTVLLGPGPRLGGLEALARAVDPTVNGPLSVEVERLDDLAQLLGARPARGRLVLDGDNLPAEDLGFVRRFLAAHPRWSVLLVGEDAGRRTARAVLAQPRTGWLSWPPDLQQLEEIVSAPDDLRPPRPALRATEEAGAAPVPGLSSQVAELAGLAGRVDRAYGALRESGALPAEAAEDVSGELGRLVRYSRSLAWLVAPPAPGAGLVDLGTLLEDELAALTLRGKKAPRFLYRGARGVGVHADAEALTAAIEALLLLARGCAAPGEMIRVQLDAEEGDQAQAELLMDFPAGELAGADLELAASPGGLEERLPELGPNDLPAARAILQALGGQLSLAPGPGGTLLVRVRLPAVVAPQSDEATPPPGVPAAAAGE